MLTLDDIYTIECNDEADINEQCEAIQRAVNGGAWGLQGSYGRTMMDAIKAGRCLLGTKGFKDYYGNYVPSRTEVLAGTKGSYQFVCEQCGQEWADFMAEV